MNRSRSLRCAGNWKLIWRSLFHILDTSVCLGCCAHICGWECLGRKTKKKIASRTEESEGHLMHIQGHPRSVLHRMFLEEPSCRLDREAFGIVLTTLPETNIAPENGWLEDVGRLVSFWDGFLAGAILVSRRVLEFLSCSLLCYPG